MIKKRGCSKLGQVWIETVIYTLIGLLIIGALIAIVTPRINQMKDKATIGQTIEAMNAFNSKFLETASFPANTRQVVFNIKKGNYVIDSLNDSFYYVLEGSNLEYSEINEIIKNGDLNIKTVSRNSKYDIYISLNYSSYDLFYNSEDNVKTLTPASLSYNLLIENLGDKKINIKLLN